MCVLDWTSKCIWVKSTGKTKRPGYYVCTSGNRKRLHVAMWEAEAGVAVPPGCVIHHVNWNKGDNVIENLVCVTVSEHERIHNTPGGREFGEKLKKERGTGVPPGIDLNGI